VATDLDTIPGPGPRGVLCDECGVSEAVLSAHYPGIRARPPRWCGPCCGQLLAGLVARGQVVTVTGIVLDDGYAGTGRNRGPVELDDEVGVTDLAWTVDLAIEVLRYAKPGGLVFARALVDEGGTATADRLREITGEPALHYMTGTLNAALRTVTGRRRLRYSDRHLAKPLPPPDNPRRKIVHSYELPQHLVPILDEALTALGQPPGTADSSEAGAEVQ
jgi:hypothetical protein